MILKNMRVCALSEVDDSILMWGHYSNSFKGLVIEIDISKEKVHKINYILEDKLLEKTEKLLKDIKKSKIKEKYLSYKTKSWEYENEYRIINCRGKKNEKVKITKVILGEHYLENSIFDYKK